MASEAFELWWRTTPGKLIHGDCEKAWRAAQSDLATRIIQRLEGLREKALTINDENYITRCLNIVREEAEK